MVCGHCLVTLSLTINETLKWLSSLPILMQESFWRLQCSVGYSLPLPPSSGIWVPVSTSLEMTQHQTTLTKPIKVDIHGNMKGKASERKGLQTKTVKNSVTGNVIQHPMWGVSLSYRLERRLHLRCLSDMSQSHHPDHQL